MPCYTYHQIFKTPLKNMAYEEIPPKGLKEDIILAQYKKDIDICWSEIIHKGLTNLFFTHFISIGFIALKYKLNLGRLDKLIEMFNLNLNNRSEDIPKFKFHFHQELLTSTKDLKANSKISIKNWAKKLASIHGKNKQNPHQIDINLIMWSGKIYYSDENPSYGLHNIDTLHTRGIIMIFYHNVIIQCLTCCANGIKFGVRNITSKYLPGLENLVYIKPLNHDTIYYMDLAPEKNINWKIKFNGKNVWNCDTIIFMGLLSFIFAVILNKNQIIVFKRKAVQYFEQQIKTDKNLTTFEKKRKKQLHQIIRIPVKNILQKTIHKIIPKILSILTKQKEFNDDIYALIPYCQARNKNNTNNIENINNPFHPYSLEQPLVLLNFLKEHNPEICDYFNGRIGKDILRQGNVRISTWITKWDSDHRGVIRGLIDREHQNNNNNRDNTETTIESNEQPIVVRNDGNGRCSKNLI